MLGLPLTCLSASSQAADKAPCAAKPFSLAKPGPPPVKPVAQPAKKAPVKVATTPARPLADCKKKPAGG